MTLKEIEKLIDEADVVYGESVISSYFLEIRKIDKKAFFKKFQKDFDAFDKKFSFYKRNKETGEMTLLAKVDHIDKEKKIIKKKLDEMTEEEINQVMDRICNADDDNDCDDCPFDYGKKCLASFPFWKKLYKDNKDKEFDVEVEE